MTTHRHGIAVLATTTRLAILLGVASCGGSSEPTTLSYADTCVLDGQVGAACFETLVLVSTRP